jgi:hypothetical protein
MRALLVVILFAIVGLSAFIARRWATTRSAPAPAPVVGTIEPTLASEPPAGSDPDTLEAPDAERDGAQRPKGALSASVGGLVPVDDLEPKEVVAPDIAARYADWPQDRLQDRLTELESVFLLEVDQACDARFEAGQYRVVDASEVEGLDDSYDVLSPTDSDGILRRCRMVAREEPAGEEGDVEGSFEYQIVTLGPESHPELYQRLHELEWLRARTAATDPE